MVSYRTVIGLMQVEEFASGMRPACQFNTRCLHSGEQGFVPAIVVDQQMALPVLQKIMRMPAAATALIIEDNNARPGIKVIVAIGP